MGSDPNPWLLTIGGGAAGGILVVLVHTGARRLRRPRLSAEFQRRSPNPGEVALVITNRGREPARGAFVHFGLPLSLGPRTDARGTRTGVEIREGEEWAWYQVRCRDPILPGPSSVAYIDITTLVAGRWKAPVKVRTENAPKYEATIPLVVGREAQEVPHP